MTKSLPAGEDSPGSMYNRTFWMAFAANMLLVTANTLTFRFAEFVKFLGGTEELTGLIVSFGLIGSLFWRAFLGQAIDRFGVRKIWLLSSVVYLIGCGMILTTHHIGWQIYAARVVFALGMASMFSAALAHVQSLAPPERRTEIIGTYGASGFIGMICGAQLGDLIFHILPESQTLYYTLFGLTMALGAGHGALALIMTDGHTHISPEITPPMHRLMIRYWPPMVLVVTMMMGLVFAVTTVFLTRYATELGLGGIRTFFSAYAISAFMMRILARQWSRTAGRHRLIVYGLGAHSISQLALVFVTKDWQLIPAALCGGFGHALLFPCVVSLGAGAFPEQYRGTGTTITLAAVDVGTIVTAPLLGWMIDNYGFHSMFYAACATTACAGALYALVTWRMIDTDIATVLPRRRMKAARKQRSATVPSAPLEESSRSAPDDIPVLRKRA